jgi:hypothetical protein
MPFSVAEFVKLRPFAYHVTCLENLPRIRRKQELESASLMAGRSNRPLVMNTKRRVSESIVIDGEEVWVQNQAPLHEGNVSLDGNWTFDDLLSELNSLVFFWPGCNRGPIPHGQRHFQSALWRSGPIVLRVPTGALVQENNKPLFCRFNAGAPRWSGGHASPRGPNTFLPNGLFDGRPGKVVELAFRSSVRLPLTTQLRLQQSQEWKTLHE